MGLCNEFCCVVEKEWVEGMKAETTRMRSFLIELKMLKVLSGPLARDKAQMLHALKPIQATMFHYGTLDGSITYLVELAFKKAISLT